MSGLAEHDERSELRQPAGPERWWQDSAFLVWNDHDAGIGGVFRIGHEPHHDGGIGALWFGLVTRDGRRYRRNVSAPLTAADRRDDGFGALDGRYRITYDGRVRYHVVDDDVRVDLTVEDFFPRTDFFPSDAGTVSDDFASSHFEVSGRITGTVRLGDRDHVVDGLCHRDRSWGVRRWDTLLNHRWIPGTFGPDLSFGSIAWHAIDGTIRQFGYVVRDGVVTHAEQVDITVVMEADGTTYRAGRGVWTLPGGESFVIDCAPYDAMVFEHHGVGDVDAICELERDGRRGFCDLAVSTNPRAGRGPITAALRATNVDGLSHRG
ncbi:MAG: hypothetical protein M0P31_03395 [Solirubrobacteraceae bacterium]|nr:hypothetical protein [Solirubrobacteraceae bacterium]